MRKSATASAAAATAATSFEEVSFAASWHKALYFLIGTVVAVVAFGLLLSSLIRFDPRLSNPWPSQPVAILISYWFASFAIIGGAAVRFKNMLSPSACWYAWVFFWMIAASIASIFLVGASFLFVVPVFVTTLVAAVFAKVFNDLSGENGDIIWSLVFAAVASGLIWLPLERLFYDAVGFKMAGLNFFRIAMVGTSLIGLLSLLSEKDRFRFTLTSVFVSVIALIFAIAASS